MKIFLFVCLIHLTSAAAVLSYCAIWRQTFSNLAQPTDSEQLKNPNLTAAYQQLPLREEGLSGTLPVTMH